MLDDRTDDDVEPMRPNRRRRSAVHLGATFMRLLVVVGALVILGALWCAVTGRYIGGDGPYSYLTLDALPQLHQALPVDAAAIRIVDLPLWARALAYTPGVISGVTMVLVALTTQRVLIAIAAAHPFERTTARRVRTVGLLLAVGGTLTGLTDTIAMYTFMRVLGDEWSEVYSTLYYTADWPWALIITGVVVVAASAAFTEGARLQRESDGVV